MRAHPEFSYRYINSTVTFLQKHTQMVLYLVLPRTWERDTFSQHDSMRYEQIRKGYLLFRSIRCGYVTYRSSVAAHWIPCCSKENRCFSTNHVATQRLRFLEVLQKTPATGTDSTLNRPKIRTKFDFDSNSYQHSTHRTRNNSILTATRDTEKVTKTTFKQQSTASASK